MASSWWNSDWQESDEDDEEVAKGEDEAEGAWTTAAATQETWQEEGAQAWQEEGAQAWQEDSEQVWQEGGEWQHTGEEDEQVADQAWEDVEWQGDGWGADDEY